MTDSIIQHLLENKKHTANHRNSKKTTTFVFNKCSVTYLRKCPIIQHLVSDSGHSQKRLKESGTTHICKAMKYTDLHLSPHSVYLSKQRLYRLKWTVTDNQWCKYAASKSCFWDLWDLFLRLFYTLFSMNQNHEEILYPQWSSSVFYPATKLQNSVIFSPRMSTKCKIFSRILFADQKRKFSWGLFPFLPSAWLNFIARVYYNGH